MIVYALYVWSQTLLALAGLGLIGLWVLWPFRSPDRPFFYLAAPLAGIAALAGSLYILFYGAHLPLAWAVVVSGLALSSLSIACVLRGRGLVRRPSKSETRVFFAAVTIASIWGAYTCNWTAIRAGEPTLAITDGSDSFGYVMIADWLIAHPASDPPQVDRLFEVMPYACLYKENSRPGAFLVTAAATFIRGTTSMFSYDLQCGIVLSAGILALAGLFASRPLGLALLVATGISSAWLTDSRTGYLGKTLAYTGCMLLCAMFLDAWIRPSRTRIAVACLFGLIVAFLCNPVVPMGVLGLVLGGGLLALLSCRLFGWSAPPFSTDSPPAWMLFVRGILLYAGMTGPALLVIGRTDDHPIPVDWDFSIPVSLDLEVLVCRLVGLQLSTWLTVSFFMVTLLLLLVAVRRRDILAQGFLLCSGLVPVAWLLGKTELHNFHGILYPLTMIGAVMLLGGHWPLAAAHSVTIILTGAARVRRFEFRGCRQPEFTLTVILAAVLVAMHAPQLFFACNRYLIPGASWPIVYKRSEMDALRSKIGNRTVDVALSNWQDAHAVVADLGCHGTKVLLRSPAWDLTLRNWAASSGPSKLTPSGLPLNDPFTKGQFSIFERWAYSPPGTRRWHGNRLKLCEDENAVTFVGYRDAIPWVRPDKKGSPCLWLGNRPIIVQIYNGTGGSATSHFVASTVFSGNLEMGPSARTIHYSSSSGEGMRLLNSMSTQDEINLQLILAPGLNELVLWVGERMILPVGEPPRVIQEPLRFIQLERFRLETPGSGDVPDPKR